ncbi:MAG: DUF2007 domain-containing protein [bacterium]|nr:DUF2007 domain-containing protein [bacterium]
MILLASFTNELEAQLLESQLQEAGVDVKTTQEGNDAFKVMVFEDDLELAKEIMEARSLEDDDFLVDLDEPNLDELSDDLP